MNGMGQRRKRLVRVRKQFECSHSEQAMLARVYERILPDVRLVLPQHSQNVESPWKAGRPVDRRRQAQPIGA
jgi:hypothetical protein